MDLTRMQFREILGEKLTERGGLEDLTRMLLEILMEGERSLYKEETGDMSNGYRPRQVLHSGQILELRVPRTRRQGFYPKVLAILKEETRELEGLSSLLYRQGSTVSEISEVLDYLYGKNYSTSHVNRLCMSTCMSTIEAIQEWQKRPLPSRVEALIIDACYLSVRRGGTVGKEAFFVVMCLKEEESRDILGVYNNPTEGSGIWRSHFEDLKKRGLKEVKLIMSDALRGIEEVCEEYFHGVDVQLCTVHAEREILTRVRAKDRATISEELKGVFIKTSDVRGHKQGIEKYQAFCKKWGKSYPFLKNKADDARSRYLFTYLDYLPEQRSYIYTTNWVERFNRNIKGSSKKKMQYPSPESALNHLSNIAMHADYLRRKIGPLKGGLRKINEV